MNPYIAWTPDTGTTELDILRRGWPVEDQHTQEIPFWIPSVPTLVTRPSHMARLRKFAAGLGVVFGCLALSAVPATPMDAPAVAVQR